MNLFRQDDVRAIIKMQNVPMEIWEELFTTKINGARDISSICSVCRSWVKFRSFRWKIIDPETLGVRFRALLTYPNLVTLKGPYVLMNLVREDEVFPESNIDYIRIITCNISGNTLKSLGGMFKRCKNFKIYGIKSRDKNAGKEHVLDEEEDKRISILITPQEIEGKFSFGYMLQALLNSIYSLRASLAFSRKETRDGWTEYHLSKYIIFRKNKEILEGIISRGKSLRSISQTAMLDFLRKGVNMSLFSMIHQDKECRYSQDFVDDLHFSFTSMEMTISLRNPTSAIPQIPSDEFIEFFKNFQGFSAKEDNLYKGLDILTCQDIIRSTSDILKILSKRADLNKIKALDLLFPITLIDQHPLVTDYYEKGLRLERYHLLYHADIADGKMKWMIDRRKEGSIVEFYKPI